MCVGVKKKESIRIRVKQGKAKQQRQRTTTHNSECDKATNFKIQLIVKTHSIWAYFPENVAKRESERARLRLYFILFTATHAVCDDACGSKLKWPTDYTVSRGSNKIAANERGTRSSGKWKRERKKQGPCRTHRNDDDMCLCMMRFLACGLNARFPIAVSREPTPRVKKRRNVAHIETRLT